MGARPPPRVDGPKASTNAVHAVPRQVFLVCPDPSPCPTLPPRIAHISPRPRVACPAMPLTLVFSALVLGLSSPGPGSVFDPPDLYRKSVAKAIGRAQADLERSLELWADHSTWANAWRASTENYTVRTTASRHFGLDLAQGLETMLGHFDTLLAPTRRIDGPLEVFIFPSIAEYNQFGNDFGAEHSSAYGSFYAQGSPELAVGVLFDENLTLLRMWVTHSALHQYLDRAFPRQPPTWVSEGLAAYFSLFWDNAYGISEIDRIRKNRTAAGTPAPTGQELFVPLGALLTEGLNRYVGNADNRFIQLGMLFTYLLVYREDTRTVIDGDTVAQAPFAEYLRAILQGADHTQLPVHALLTERTSELEADFRAFEF